MVMNIDDTISTVHTNAYSSEVTLEKRFSKF